MNLHERLKFRLTRTGVHLLVIAACGIFTISIVAQGVKTRALARRLAEIQTENEAKRGLLRAEEADRTRLASPERIRSAAERGGMVPGDEPPQPARGPEEPEGGAR